MPASRSVGARAVFLSLFAFVAGVRKGRKAFDDGGPVLRRRTAAAGHQAQAEFADVLFVGGGGW